VVGPAVSTAARDLSFGFNLIKSGPEPSAFLNGFHSKVELIQGKTPVTSTAKDIRSKNAGPYEITFDIIFNDLETYNFAKESPKLTAEYLAPLWHANKKDVIACQFSEPGRAFKFTLPRPWQAGGFGERDLHCSQQHVPLLNLIL
jgi:hypothetical protein